MLIAAKKMEVKRLVFASSAAVYGNSDSIPKVESMQTSPLSPYALNKLMGEQYCKLFADTFSLPTICLRYFNVFGPKQSPNSQYAAAIPKFISAYLTDTAPVVFGDGEQTRDFVYVQNVIEANINACFTNNIKFGDIFNVGCGQQITLNELIDKIADIFGKNIQVEYSDVRPGDIKYSVSSIDKIISELRYNKMIDLKSGLEQTIQWYQKKQVDLS